MATTALIDVSINKSETDNIATMKNILSEFYPELEFDISDFNETQFRVKIAFDNAKDNEDYQSKLVDNKIWISHY